MSDFHPAQWAAQYETGGRTLTLGPYSLPGDAYQMVLQLREQGHEGTVVRRTITPWEREPQWSYSAGGGNATE